MSEAVERVARAIVAELAKQDGDETVWLLENGRLKYIDQEDIDMFAVARAAIEAMYCAPQIVYGGTTDRNHIPFLSQIGNGDAINLHPGEDADQLGEGAVKP